MVEKSIIESINNYLQVLRDNGIENCYGVLYGSYANGRSHKWSDIDLIVVAPRFDGERKRQDSVMLWNLAADVDNRIEPIPCGLRQWEEDDSSAIIEIARREGVRITL
ncbi:nucleotidyltransferase domain-containing protein [bacterium]|nr:nucleotidyltransferase domain-containing protein [bacterium]